MRELWATLRDFARRDFHPAHYACVAAFLALALGLNYQLDFKRSVLNALRARPAGVPGFALFYALPYLFAVGSGAWLRRDATLVRSPAFWGFSLFAVLGLALESCSVALPGALLAALDVPPALRGWLGAMAVNADRSLGLALPVLALLALGRGPARAYGITLRGFAWRPPLAMLAACAPLVLWASSQPGFLETYPRYRPGPAEPALGVPACATFLAFELTRAARFLSIELFFRGFLVLGLARRFGPAVVLPMVSLYTVWHFGKPLPEALASAGAAWVLAAHCLRTGSIAGAIVVHVGVAMGMELAAGMRLYGPWGS